MQLQAKYVVLALLRSQPMTGYDMKKHFEGPISFFFEGSYGSVYPTLNKLEQEGNIEKKTVLQDDRPNKHEYSITSSGQSLLDAYFREPISDDQIRSDLCMRLFFGDMAEASEWKSWIQQNAAQHEEKLALLQGMQEEYRDTIPNYQRLSLTIGIRYHQGQIAALRECMQLLETESNGGV